MNIFSKPETFIGELPTRTLGEQFQTLLRKAAAICRSLGMRQNLFHEYFSNILETMACANELVNTDNGEGVQNALHNIGHSIIKGETETTQRYPELCAWISNFQELANQGALISLLIGGCSFQYLGRYRDDILAGANAIKETRSFQRIQKLYPRIAELLGGEEQLEAFNQLCYRLMSAVCPADMCLGEVLYSVQDHLFGIEPASGRYYIEMLLTGTDYFQNQGEN